MFAGATHPALTEQNGPGLSTLMAKAIPSMTGKAKGKAASASAKSNIDFMWK